MARSYNRTVAGAAAKSLISKSARVLAKHRAKFRAARAKVAKKES